jgi:nucleoside-diphosphate-sugar epimerase
MAAADADAANGNGMDVIVMRPRFVWGRDDTTALPQLAAAAKSGKLAWFDGGDYLTSTTHIANVVEGVRLCLEKGRGGEVYFVTDGEDIAFRPWVTALLATQGIALSGVKSMPRGLMNVIVNAGELLANLTGGALSGPIGKQEYATVGNTVTLNIAKARRELGYAPVMSRAAGLAELEQGRARPPNMHIQTGYRPWSVLGPNPVWHVSGRGMDIAAVPAR